MTPEQTIDVPQTFADAKAWLRQLDAAGIPPPAVVYPLGLTAAELEILRTPLSPRAREIMERDTTADIAAAPMVPAGTPGPDGLVRDYPVYPDAASLLWADLAPDSGTQGT